MTVLETSIIDLEINGKQLSGLLDTDASEFFMTLGLEIKLGLSVKKISKDHYHWMKKSKSYVKGVTEANLVIGSENFMLKNVKFTLVNNLVCNVIVELKVV